MAKLRPRARIIRTIGDQLISGPEAALIELVKNAYDADATWIKIKIAPSCKDFPKGLVQILDNGHGMTRLDIEEKWFEPATDFKKLNRLSRSGNRRVLGAKGIGRFASARLGRIINLSSIALNANGTLENTCLELDWGQFESERYLEELDIPITTKAVQRSKEVHSGVSIEITNSRVDWTEKSLEKIINELRRLVSPKDVQGEFKIFLDLSCFVATPESKEHPGFDGNELLRLTQSKINTSSNEEESTEQQLIVPYQIQEKADYVLMGQFDATGGFSGNFFIERGDNVPQKIIVPAPPIAPDEDNCGSFSIKIQIYDLEPEAVQGLFERMGLDFGKFGIRKARKILAENVGIGVYRDGFRIRPYGEAENDWLMLERRRIQEPSKRIGHTQTSGQVFIESEESSKLIERSSREGFEHSASFERLRALITTVLIRAEEKRFDYRQQAGLSRKPAGDVEHAKDLASLSNLVSIAKTLPAPAQKLLLDGIEKESAAITKSLDEISAYQKLLESRSALGMVVARVIHDGRRYLEPMSYAATSLLEGRDSLFDTTSLGEVIRKYYPVHATTIDTGVKGLSSLFKALDPVSGRRRGKPLEFPAMEVIKTAVGFMEDFIIDGGVEVEIEDSAEVTLKGYRGDLQSALLNILDNALHWLSTTTQANKRITISAAPLEKYMLLFIANNGPTIDSSSSAKLFDPGFTLKTEGHGLGLVIAREACRSSKGDLLFDQNKMDTTFIIKFPSGKNT